MTSKRGCMGEYERLIMTTTSTSREVVWYEIYSSRVKTEGNATQSSRQPTSPLAHLSPKIARL